MAGSSEGQFVGWITYVSIHTYIHTYIHPSYSSYIGLSVHSFIEPNRRIMTHTTTNKNEVCKDIFSSHSLANVLLQNPASTPFDNSGKSPPGEEQRHLSGLMRYMSPQHVQMLLSCLDLSYELAIAFDSRPGLKFLVQRVAGLERASNLYRQAGAAWTIKVVTLFDLCLHEVGRSGATLDKVKRILEDQHAGIAEVRKSVSEVNNKVLL